MTSAELRAVALRILGADGAQAEALLDTVAALSMADFAAVIAELKLLSDEQQTAGAPAEQGTT